MLTWPSVLKPSGGGFAPFVRSLSGGQSLSGFEQVQPQLHDRWSAAFTFPMQRNERILAMRALLTSLRGRTNTIGLPVFDRVPRPVSTATPGSPVGTTISNPPFASLATMMGSPVGTTISNPPFADLQIVGTTVSNPPFASLATMMGSPVGTTTSNPVVATRWPSLAGTAYEYTTVAGLTGSAEIEGLNRVRFTPSGTEPEAGQYITLASERRKIEVITNDGADRILMVSPSFNASQSPQYTVLSAITGSAEIEGSNRVRFTPSGTEPAAGQYVTLASKRRRIHLITNDGADRILTVVPSFDEGLFPEQYVAASGVTGSATIAGLNRVRFTPSGTPPAVGQYVTLASQRRRIQEITAAGADFILTIDPSFNASLASQYTALAAITGSATIQGPNRVRFTPSGTQPAVGQYVTLVSVRRQIEKITNDGSDRILTITPPFTIAAATPGTVTATVAANAAINAVSIDVTFSSGGPPLAGHRFSLGSRLYSIDGVTLLSPNNYRLAIWPWLRAAATSADTANFSAPVCEMRLASDQDGADAMRSLSAMRFGDVTLRFDEVAVT